VAVATRQHRSPLHRRVSPHSHVLVYCAGVRTAHTRVLHPRACARLSTPARHLARLPASLPRVMELDPRPCRLASYTRLTSPLQSSCRNGCGHHGHQWPLPISVPAVSISPAPPPVCL
jgi:hypothetical protein